MSIPMMDFSWAFERPRPLSSLLDELHTLPDQWLYIPRGLEQLELSTPCQACIADVKQFSPEEQDELDEYPGTVGLQRFLCLTQLEDIIANLREQRHSPTGQDVLAAINYYWSNDAFIEVHGQAQ